MCIMFLSKFKSIGEKKYTIAFQKNYIIYSLQLHNFLNSSVNSSFQILQLLSETIFYTLKFLRYFVIPVFFSYSVDIFVFIFIFCIDMIRKRVMYFIIKMIFFIYIRGKQGRCHRFYLTIFKKK